VIFRDASIPRDESLSLHPSSSPAGIPLKYVPEDRSNRFSILSIVRRRSQDPRFFSSSYPSCREARGNFFSPSDAIESPMRAEERLSSAGAEFSYVPPLFGRPLPSAPRRAAVTVLRYRAWESSAWILTASPFDERIPRDPPRDPLFLPGCEEEALASRGARAGSAITERATRRRFRVSVSPSLFVAWWPLLHRVPQEFLCFPRAFT